MSSSASKPAADTTAAPFVWTDAYALGFSPMDATHHEFVDTVNAMLTASDADFPQALDAFVDHAKRHFDEEAEWMTSTNFPAGDCHIDEHNAVMKSVLDVQQLVKDGHVKALEVGRSLAAELVKWFPGHADYLDSALSHWMSKRTYGGKPVVIRKNLAHNDPLLKENPNKDAGHGAAQHEGAEKSRCASEP